MTLRSHSIVALTLALTAAVLASERAAAQVTPPLKAPTNQQAAPAAKPVTAISVSTANPPAAPSAAVEADLASRYDTAQRTPTVVAPQSAAPAAAHPATPTATRLGDIATRPAQAQPAASAPVTAAAAAAPVAGPATAAPPAAGSQGIEVARRTPGGGIYEYITTRRHEEQVGPPPDAGPYSYQDGPPQYPADSLPDPYATGDSCANPTCDSCVPCQCCDDRRWYFRADALILSRTDNDGTILATSGVLGPPALSSGDFKFQYEPLTRLAIGAPLNDCWLLETQYFGWQSWNDDQVVTAANASLFSIYSRYGLDGVLGFQDTDQAILQGAHYGSKIQNLEFNALYRLSNPCCPGGTYLINGLRYFQLREAFDYVTVTNTDVSATSIRTNNELIGYQLGLRYESPIYGKLWFLLDGKAGLYSNIASFNNLTNATINGVLRESDDHSSLAFLSDLGVTLRYDVFSWLGVRAGYNLMWVESVALAPENFLAIPRPGNPLRQVRIDDHGQVLYHGFNLGLEARW